MQRELRGAAVSNDLDVTPQHALRMAGAERLHRGLLRREAAREMNGRVAAARAVRDLAFSEDSLQKAVTVSLDRVGDTGDVGGVETKADDVCHDDDQS